MSRTDEVFQRLSAEDLQELDKFDVMKGPSYRRAPAEYRDGRIQSRKFRWALSKFLDDEGVIAVLTASYRDGGLINVFGFDHQPERTFSTSAVTAPPAKPGASEECEPLKAALRNRKRFLCAP